MGHTKKIMLTLRNAKQRLEYNIFDEFTVEEADNFLELVVRTDFFLCKHDYWSPVRE